VTSSPIVLHNGTAICNTSDLFLQQFVQRAKAYGKKIIWRDGMLANNLKNVIFNNSWNVFRNNYLTSINNAVSQCGVSGIEFDFEPEDGIMSVNEVNTYSAFLVAMKQALGPTKEIGACVGVYGLTEGSFPLMERSWIDAAMVNSGGIDYLNLMSYHWPILNDIEPWIQDAFMYTKIWGFNSSKINIGIPYFNLNGTFGQYNEPLWCNLSDDCPNINPSQNVCNDITIVSKQQNYNIGQFVREYNFRGIFPWSSNYDSQSNNNSMISWAYAGLYG